MAISPEAAQHILRSQCGLDSIECLVALRACAEICMLQEAMAQCAPIEFNLPDYDKALEGWKLKVADENNTFAITVELTEELREFLSDDNNSQDSQYYSDCLSTLIEALCNDESLDFPEALRILKETIANGGNHEDALKLILKDPTQVFIPPKRPTRRV